MIFKKKRLKLIQEAYDMGYTHGVADGKVEKHGEIIHMLTKKLDGTDWLQEDPVDIRDIVPLVKGEKTTKTKEDIWG